MWIRQKNVPFLQNAAAHAGMTGEGTCILAPALAHELIRMLEGLPCKLMERVDGALDVVLLQDPEWEHEQWECGKNRPVKRVAILLDCAVKHREELGRTIVVTIDSSIAPWPCLKSRIYGYVIVIFSHVL